MKTMINDTCNIIAKRLSDNKIAFSAETQLSNIGQKITTEDIRGGIGSRLIAINKNNKDVEINIKSVIWDSDFTEMVFGLIVTGDNSIFKKEDNLICIGKTFDDSILIDEERELDLNYEFDDQDDASVLINYLTGVPYTNKVEIQNIPKENGIIKVIDSEGIKYEVDEFINNYIVLIDDVEGIDFIALYEYEVSGNTMNMDISKFPEAYSLELITIEYSLINNIVVNDLYFIFNKTLPSGNFDLSFENGKVITSEIDFKVLSMPGTNELGKIIEVPRVS